MVSVFIGSDERGGRGELVMTHGIKTYASGPVRIVYMRPDGEGGHWEYNDWYMGRNHPRPYSGEGWATNFTCFRWSIPEVAGFEGRAIYMDADQTVHGDVYELANCDLAGKACSIRKGVIVFDCGHKFWRGSTWPRLEVMKPSGLGLGAYQKLIVQAGEIAAPFDVAWDVLDGKEMSVWSAKLNHYTEMRTQPYHPFPDRFRYPYRHPKPEVDEVWWQAYRSTMEANNGVVYPAYKKFDNLVKWCVEQERAAGLDCFGRPVGSKYWFTDMETMKVVVPSMNPQFRGTL